MKNTAFTFLLLFLLIVISVSSTAAETNQENVLLIGGVVISVDESASVPVSIETNTNCNEAMICLRFSKELTFIEVTDGEIANVELIGIDLEQHTVKFKCSDIEVGSIGNLAFVRFLVPKYSRAGDTYNISCANTDTILYDAEHNIAYYTLMDNYESGVSVAAETHEHEWGRWFECDLDSCMRTCEICGESEYDIHDWFYSEIPTYSDSVIGLYSRYCSRCNALYEKQGFLSSSSHYTINEEDYMLTDVSAKTSILEFLNNFDCKSIRVYDSYGYIIDESFAAYIGTGFKVVLYDEDGNYIFELSVVVPGDINYDGMITPLDRLILTRYLAGWQNYADKIVSKDAADLNRDGKISAMDRLILSRHLAGWPGYETIPLLPTQNQ